MLILGLFEGNVDMIAMSPAQMMDSSINEKESKYSPSTSSSLILRVKYSQHFMQAINDRRIPPMNKHDMVQLLFGPFTKLFMAEIIKIIKSRSKFQLLNKRFSMQGAILDKPSAVTNFLDKDLMKKCHKCLLCQGPNLN